MLTSDDKRRLAVTCALALAAGAVLYLLADRLPSVDWEPDLPPPRPVYAPYSGRLPGEPADSVVIHRDVPTVETFNPGV